MHHEHDGGAPYSRMMEDGTDAFCRGAGVAMLNGWQVRSIELVVVCVLTLILDAYRRKKTHY